MLGFMAKKASIAVQTLRWKSSSRMVVAGSHSAPRRFPCVPANPAPVLTPQKRESPWAGAQLPAVLQLCSGSSICRCHRCGAAPRSAGGRACTGKRPAPELPTSMQNTKPKNQATPRNGRSSPWMFWKAESAAGPQLPKQDLSHSSGFFPSLHAPEHLVDEAASEP